MMSRAAWIALLLVFAPPALHADSPVWIVRSLSAEPDNATPLLLQADGDATPEWGVLLGHEVTIAEISADAPIRKLSLPTGSALFDLRDTDRNGKVELAVVRAGRLEYWPDATTASGADPAFSIGAAAIDAMSTGGPRPFALFLEDRGEDFITLPIGGSPSVWALDGTPLPVPVASPLQPLILSQFHAWTTDFEDATAGIRISQRYELDHADFAPPPGAARAAPVTSIGGTRRARDASAAPPEEWPWFTLSGASRVLYGLAPPDFRDTLIRVDRRDAQHAASSTAPNPRRYPGILIAPGEAGSDFNGDGFNDLLLWHATRPGASLDSLIRAAQDGGWDVELTVHLFDPASGRFAARPISWIHTEAPLEGVLAGGIRGPFRYLSIEDLDGNGRADLVCTGAGSDMAAWTFGDRRESSPWARVEFPEPIDEVVLTARIPGYHWLGIVRSAHAFHLAALAKR